MTDTIPFASVRPIQSLDLLSQREMESLASADHELHQLFRRCALAVLNTGGDTDDAREMLMRRAAELVPELDNCEVVRHWAGLRPGVSDGVPYIGPLPGFDGLLVPFETSLQIAPSQTNRTQLDIPLRQPGTAVNRCQQFAFRFIVFLNTHERHGQVVMGCTAIRIRGDGLSLLGDVFLCIPICFGP